MLKKINLCGFKSIRQMTLELKPLNVLIGANGAGKTNLIDFFRLLNSLRNRRLQFHIGRFGGAHTLLHYEGQVTDQIDVQLHFDTPAEGSACYGMQLATAPIDTLVFAREFLESGDTMSHQTQVNDLPNLGSGHKESLVFENRNSLTPLAKQIHSDLDGYRMFHFQNTSETSRMRVNCDIHNHSELMNDGGNLAAVLYRLQQTQCPYYERILDTIRLITPFFDDFVLAPLASNPDYIQLLWQSRHSTATLGPHQLSDGTLRTMALITLLLQPESELPSLILLDEPELGLHPHAITMLASILHSVAVHTQIILATQSTNLLDHFDPEDVIVVEQRQGVSSFKRLDPEPLEEWLEEYTLSELWEKNVIGGRPSR